MYVFYVITRNKYKKNPKDMKEKNICKLSVLKAAQKVELYYKLLKVTGVLEVCIAERQ